jgi:hypothetical protein
MAWRRRGAVSPNFPVEEHNIFTRDGKALPVDFTLKMAREVIEDPVTCGREVGLALALEAALMAIKEGAVS